MVEGVEVSSLSAIGLFRGPCHVVEYMSEDLVEILRSEPLGMPAAEAFPEPAYRRILQAMSRVYATGRPEVLPWENAKMTITPRLVGGRVAGVSTHRPVTPPVDPPPPQPLLPLPVELLRR
jgi:hypothetical protein